MMGLVRTTKAKVRGSGFVVTWDVDSRNRSAANKLMMFLFGRTVRKGGRVYEYPGFVWREGVRYLAQSALFVSPHRLAELIAVLDRLAVDHDLDQAFYP